MGKRSSNGEGSFFYDEANDRWMWKGYYRDPDGINRRKTLVAKKRSELRKKIKKWQTEQMEGQVVMNWTLSQFGDEWLKTIKPTIKPRTYEAYKGSVKNHIIPQLGKYRLIKIQPFQVQELLQSLAERYAPSTVNTVRRHLIIIFNAACDNGFIRVNPAALTKPIKQKKEGVKVLALGQLRKLLKIVHEKEYLPKKMEKTPDEIYLLQYTEMLVSLLAHTGMRVGEALALQWTDFARNTGSIRITKTLVNGANGISIGPPKTATSKRTLLLPVVVQRQMAKWHEQQRRYGEKIGDLFQNDHNLIFPNSHGNFMSYSNWSRRYWHRATAVAGLPPGITPHCLRHTLASLLIAAGTPLQVVSRQLGHAGTDVTLRIYTHLVPGTEKAALTAIEKIFFQEKTVPDVPASGTEKDSD